MTLGARQGSRPARLTRTTLVVLAGSLWIALAAWAQTIKIPDFRQPPPVASVKPGEPCSDCGRILSIREIQAERKPVVPPAFQGGGPGTSSAASERNLVGAVIYLPLGNDGTQRPFVGGVGTPEMRERFRETTYEIAVRLDDGTLHFVQRVDGTRYRVGDRVRLSGVNQIELVSQ
jgi:outer membrane lipoprotein SlyB